MTTQVHLPADTRMMRIVHQAMRRDLQRAQRALTSTPPPSPRQLHAIATHLTWMMQFIRAHHYSEDHGLYPLVRDRQPPAAELLGAMNADHENVAAAVSSVEQAAAETVVHPKQLGDAVDRLVEVLLPHLQREETDMMAVVSSVVTNEEWQAIEYEYNLKPKSFVELGREGQWLIDDATPEDRAAVLGLVPPVPRFLLAYGFARSYRRQAAACWGVSARPKRRVQMTGSCEVDVDAGIDAVWGVVRDVTRVGEWSHECVDVEWLGGATFATPGARFRGRNRAGVFRWGRVCEVVSVEPYELVWRTVASARYPDSTEWTIRLRPAAGGTRIEQRFNGHCPAVLAVLYALLIPGHRDRTTALTEDLRRLGAVAARSTPARAQHATPA